MVVPDADIVCRFIRPKDWNSEEKEPRESLFKADRQALSLFHTERVGRLGSNIKDLCFGSLEGAGLALLSASAYKEEAEQCKVPVDANVYFRPNDVKDDWLPWRDAHVNVETTICGSEFPKTYRVMLLNRLVADDDFEPPDGF